MAHQLRVLGDVCRYPSQLKFMPRNSQWSIGRLFLWVFIAALIVSHLANFYQRQIVGFTDFSLDGSDIKQWLTELDPSIESHGGGEGSSSSGDFVDSDLNYVFTSKNTTSQQILDHLKSKIRQHLADQNWSIHGWGEGGESFSFKAYNGDTNFRIYGWLVPSTEDSYARQLEKMGETVTTIKILRVGYLRP